MIARYSSSFFGVDLLHISFVQVVQCADGFFNNGTEVVRSLVGPPFNMHCVPCTLGNIIIIFFSF